MPPPVAIRRPRNRNPQPLEYDHVLDRGRRDSLIGNRFQEHILPSPVESIDGKQKLRLAVAQAFGHCRRSVARKQRENNSAEFRHGKKCRHRLRHHGHEERRYIPFLHAERAERVSQTANITIQFFVGESTSLAGFLLPRASPAAVVGAPRAPCRDSGGGCSVARRSTSAATRCRERRREYTRRAGKIRSRALGARRSKTIQCPPWIAAVILRDWRCRDGPCIFSTGSARRSRRLAAKRHHHQIETQTSTCSRSENSKQVVNISQLAAMLSLSGLTDQTNPALATSSW